MRLVERRWRRTSSRWLKELLMPQRQNSLYWSSRQAPFGFLRSLRFTWVRLYPLEKCGDSRIGLHTLCQIPVSCHCKWLLACATVSSRVPFRLSHLAGSLEVLCTPSQRKGCCCCTSQLLSSVTLGAGLGVASLSNITRYPFSETTM